MSPLHQTAEYVVVAEGPDGPVYLDDTGTGVRDIAEAKHFRDELDAREGLVIARLAPTGSAAGWSIRRLT